MLRHLTCLLALAAVPVVLAGTAPATAGTITRSFTLTADEGGPVNPFTVSFTVALDPTQNYGDTTTGISGVSVPTPFFQGGSVGFNYTASHVFLGLDASFNEVFGDEVLNVGGTANGVQSAGNGDFTVQIENAFAVDPIVTYFVYVTSTGGFEYQPANLSQGEEIGTAPTLSVQTPLSVPEPASLALLAIGLLGMAGWRRAANTRRPIWQGRGV